MAAAIEHRRKPWEIAPTEASLDKLLDTKTEQELMKCLYNHAKVTMDKVYADTLRMGEVFSPGDPHASWPQSVHTLNYTYENSTGWKLTAIQILWRTAFQGALKSVQTATWTAPGNHITYTFGIVDELDPSKQLQIKRTSLR